MNYRKQEEKINKKFACNKCLVLILLLCVLCVSGCFSNTQNMHNAELNSQEFEQAAGYDEGIINSDSSNTHTNSIDYDLVGTWISQTEKHILEKLTLSADGTGYYDSSPILWRVDDGIIIFEFSYKTIDHGYWFEDSKLHMSNGCQLVKIDGKERTKMSHLLNMKWKPDFVSYPNNYHVDNPVLELVYVSLDEKNLIFRDEFGASYAATTENGWRYFFEDDQLFYAFSLYGLDPEDGYDVPTMFVNVTEGGWYTVIYKLEK